MNIEAFGQEVKKIRKSQGVTQKQIAKDLNFSRATINTFENAKDAHIGLQKVFEILEYLEYELELKPKKVPNAIEASQWT